MTLVRKIKDKKVNFEFNKEYTLFYSYSKFEYLQL